MLQMIKNSFIYFTKNNTEYLSDKKKLTYISNYINCLCILLLNISDIYDNLTNYDESNESKKGKIHIDFCNNIIFNNKKFNIKKKDNFFPIISIII